VNALEGAAERDRRQVERIVVQAWWNEALNGAGSKLKPVKHYLDHLKPKRPQTHEEMLAVWREHAVRAPGKITIRRFGPDGKELN
jgi:hypothetical protein